MPLASPMPAISPSTEASRPITTPSSTTARMTCLREPPSVRSVANSRVRCATVIDSVLKITNAPTSSEIPPKPSRKYLRIDMLPLSSAASSSACLALSLTCRPEATSGRTARTSSADEVPRGRDRDRVEPALAVQQRLRGLQVPRRDAREAERVDLAVGDGAGQRERVLGAERRDRDPLAELVVLLGERAGVDHDLLRAGGPLARLQLERAELAMGGVEAAADALAGDGLAVTADDVGHVGLVRRNDAAGRFDLGQRLDLGQQRGGDRDMALRVESLTISFVVMTASVLS